MAVQPATDKQLAFIRSLAEERQLPVGGKTVVEATVYERIMDVLGQKPVSKGEASAAIELLLKAPRKAQESTKGSVALPPASRYAVRNAAGTLTFLEVVERKGGRRYLNQLIGAPGDWNRQWIARAAVATWAQRIAEASYDDPISGESLTGAKAAAIRFSREFTCCAACGSPLSDAESIQRGLGPVCAQRF